MFNYTKFRGISWKTILNYYSEIPDDEWISQNKFAELHWIDRKIVENHTRRLYHWNYLRRRKRIPPGRGYEYQITNSGINKLEYITRKNSLCEYL